MFFCLLFAGFVRGRGVAGGVRGVLPALQLQRPGLPASRAQPTQSETKAPRVLGGTYRGGGELCAAFRSVTVDLRFLALIRNRITRNVLYGSSFVVRGARCVLDGMRLDGIIRSRMWIICGTECSIECGDASNWLRVDCSELLRYLWRV